MALSTKINAELINASITASIVNPVVTKLVEEQVSGFKTISIQLTPEDKMLVRQVFPTAHFTERIHTGMHPLMKVFRHEHMQAVKDQLRGVSSLVILGGSLREALAVLKAHPKIKVRLILGSFDAKDYARRAEELLLAKEKLNCSDPVLAKFARHFILFSQGAATDLISSPSSYLWRSWRADACISVDSIYDMTPEVLADYMWTFQAKICHAIHLVCPELAFNHSVPNHALGVFFERSSSNVKMHFYSGAENGYVNNYQNFIDYSVRTCFAPFGKGGPLMISEIQANYHGYVRNRFVLTTSYDYVNIRSFPRCNAELIRLFDMKLWLSKHEKRYFWVDAKKYRNLYFYICSVQSNSFEFTRFITMARSALEKINVGERTIIPNWARVTDEEVIQTIHFAIWHASMQRGTFYESIFGAVTAAKEGGWQQLGICKVFTVLRTYWDEFTHGKAWIKEIEQSITFMPETYFEEYHTVNLKNSMSKTLNGVGGAVLSVNKNLTNAVDLLTATEKLRFSKQDVVHYSKGGDKLVEILHTHFTDLLDHEVALDMCCYPGGSTLALSDSFNFVTCFSSGDLAPYVELSERPNIVDITAHTGLGNLVSPTESDQLRTHVPGCSYGFAYGDGRPDPEIDQDSLELEMAELDFAAYALELGGSACIKFMYTARSVELFRMASTIFSEVYPIKPRNSVQTNSEYYLICKHKLPIRLELPTNETFFQEHMVILQRKQILGLQHSVNISAPPKPKVFPILPSAPPGLTLALNPVLPPTSVNASAPQVLSTGPVAQIIPPPVPSSVPPVTVQKLLQPVRNDRYEFGRWKMNSVELEEWLKRAKNHYDNLSNMPDADAVFKDMHITIKKTLASFRSFNSLEDTKVIIWNEYAGAGKTTECLKQFDPAKDLYICHSRHLRNEFARHVQEKYKIDSVGQSCATYEKALTENRLCCARRIYIDEVFLLSVPTLLTYMTLASKRAEFILMGDVHQNQFQDEWAQGAYGADCALKAYIDRFSQVRYNKVTHRFGPEICEILNKLYGYDISSCGSCCNKHTLVTYSSPKNAPQAGLDMAFSRKLAEQVTDSFRKSCFTVTSCQGESQKCVNMWIKDSDTQSATNRAMAIVALSRASEHLNIVEFNAGAMDRLGWSFFKLRELLETGVGRPIAPESFVLVEEELLAENVYETPAPTIGFDPTLLSEIISKAAPTESEIQNLVHWIENPLAKPFAFKPTGLDPKPKPDAFRLSHYLQGKRFRVGDPSQLLYTQLKRYAVNNTTNGKFPLPNPQRDDLWHRFKTAYLKDTMDFTQLNASLYKDMHDVYKKFYSNMSNVSKLEFDPPSETFTIRMFLKNITKVCDNWESINKNKGGQSINSWHTSLTNLFRVYFRTVTRMVMKNLNDTTIIYNQMTPEQLERKINEINAKTPILQNLMDDATEYDASQQFTSISVETHIYKMFFDADSLELMELAKRSLFVNSMVATHYSEAKKQSGAPDTLIGNTLLNMVCQMLMIDMSTAVLKMFLGDDSVISFPHDQPVRFTVHDAKYVLSLEWKLVTSPLIEFCGSMWSNGKLFSNYMRAALKVLGREYDERTFKELQISLNDSMKRLDDHRSEAIVALNVWYGLNCETIEMMLEQLLAFASPTNTWALFSRHLMKQPVVRMSELMAL